MNELKAFLKEKYKQDKYTPRIRGAVDSAVRKEQQEILELVLGCDTVPKVVQAIRRRINDISETQDKS